MDWSGVGVNGGIPNWGTCSTAACNTLAGGAVSDANIAAAISSAPALGSVVMFPAGTFTISPFSVGRDNVVLRGQGADQTKLIFNGTTGCTSGGGGFTAAICISGSFNWSGCPQNCGLSPQDVANKATWTAGFAKGTTVITLSSTTNLAAGGLIILSQEQETAGYPTSADILVAGSAGSRFSTEGVSLVGLGGQTAMYRVQKVDHAMNQVTIFPPLEAPNWRPSKNPLAWWPTHAATGVGIENMTLDGTAGSGARSVIIWENAIGNWVQGIRSIISAPDSGTGSRGVHIHHYLAAQGIVRNSYFYGYRSTGEVNYALSVGPGTLLENNIVEQHVTPFVDNGPGSNGFVIAYNYSTNGVGINGNFGWTYGIFYHSISDFMALLEGNDVQAIYLDAIHGTHNFTTAFRNYAHGQVNQTSNSETISLRSFSRNVSLVGNVLGCGTTATCPGSYPYYATYETDEGDSDIGIYGFGGSYTGNGHTVGPDAQVPLDVMRWGNYDSVTTAVRWCASSDPNFANPPCSSKSEIPTGLTNFSNANPSSHTLPASFYLSAKPPWWGTMPYPAVGPDVTGGNIPSMGGFAYKIPARVCYESLANDPAYSVNPPIKVFNAGTCYGSGGSSPIAFVQVNSVTPQTNQTSVSVSYKAAQTAGNLNVVVVGWNDSTSTVTSITDTKGNAYTLAVGPTVQSGYATQSIYYAKNIAGAAAGVNAVTVNFSAPATYVDIRIAEYSGLDPANPLDGSAAAQGNSSTSDSGPLTTSNTNDLLVGANIVQLQTTGPRSGFTSRVITRPDGDILEDETITTTGTYDATAPLDSVQPWIMQMVAFRAARPWRKRL